MKIQDTTLENGLRVITCERPTNTTIGAVFVNDHESLEGQKKGVRHLLEHMIVLGGSKKQPDKASQIKSFRRLGAYQSATTYYEMMKYFVDSRNDNFLESLELLLDAIANPVLSQKSCRDERSVINEEMKGNIENTRELAFRGRIPLFLVRNIVLLLGYFC